MWETFENIFLVFGVLGTLSYLLPVLYQYLVYGEQDLKKLYSAEWGLVTGGSTGIGKAIVEKLASQGINVVIVALPDKFLDLILEYFESKYPHLRFVSVGCDLGATDPNEYMSKIKQATGDLNIKLLFNNAGFIIPALFHKSNIQKQLTNLNCNTTSSVVITHYFINKILEDNSKNSNGKTGLITFTSSSAGFMPAPMSSLYGATKAMLTSFGCAIAAEIKDEGIDVVVIHPSPIGTLQLNIRLQLL
jgi:short-subunit dehydrogenase